MEQSGEEVVPRNGLAVADECGMLDSRSMFAVLHAARERKTIAVCCFDTRQLQPIDAGASARIVRDVAREAGTYSELRDIQRQKRGWHKAAVSMLADAIVERDDAKRFALVKTALKALDDSGAITWTATRDDAIDAAVTKVRAYEAAGVRDVLMPAADKDTVRHLAEEHRRREGRAGSGRFYVTKNGRRELAIGDGLMFLENSVGKRGLGVRNGDRGETVEASKSRITVRMDDDRVVSFSPRTYKHWDYRASTSVHKTQGASVSACVPLIDRSASAELVFVAVSRSKIALDIVVPKTAFADLDELAEHVASRISLKTTTRTYDELLERTGGKDTVRVRKIERQREAESSLLRREWQAEVIEPMRERRAARMRELRAAYAVRRVDISVGAPTLADRLEQARDASREFRSAIADIHRETKPPAFSTWVKEQERFEERMREHSRERQIERSLTRGTRSINDRGRTRQSDRDGPEHDYDFDFEIQR